MPILKRHQKRKLKPRPGKVIALPIPPEKIAASDGGLIYEKSEDEMKNEEWNNNEVIILEVGEGVEGIEIGDHMVVSRGLALKGLSIHMPNGEYAEVWLLDEAHLGATWSDELTEVPDDFVERHAERHGYKTDSQLADRVDRRN